MQASSRLLTLTKKQQNKQFSKLLALIKKKYSTTTLETCKLFLKKVQGLSPKIQNDIISKIVYIYGSKNNYQNSFYSDEEMFSLFTLCAAAQRGIAITDLRLENLTKFQNKNLKLIKVPSSSPSVSISAGKQTISSQSTQNKSQPRLERSVTGLEQQPTILQHNKQDYSAKIMQDAGNIAQLTNQATRKQNTDAESSNIQNNYLQDKYQKTNSHGSTKRVQDKLIIFQDQSQSYIHQMKTSDQNCDNPLCQVTIKNSQKSTQKNSVAQKKQEQQAVVQRNLSFGNDSNLILQSEQSNLNTNQYTQNLQNRGNCNYQERSITSSPSPITSHPSIKQNLFGNQTPELDKSISTKLVPQHRLDNIRQTESTRNDFLAGNHPKVETPTFTSRRINNFFESQEQLTELSLKKKVISQRSQDGKNVSYSGKDFLQIKIDKYIKQADGWSTVVRYQIILLPESQKQHVLRRYSQFVKLRSYLRHNYAGIIVPQLPPKETIVASFWVSDPVFLNERKAGLEEFINKLLAHHIIGKDPLLLRFINDPLLEQSAYHSQSVYYTAEKYFSTLVSITKSTQQLKDYGLAYLNYMKTPLEESNPNSQRITQLYRMIEKERDKVIQLQEYLNKIQTMQPKKQKIEEEVGIYRSKLTSSISGVSLLEQSLGIKREVQRSLVDFSQAKVAYQDFYYLRSNVSWLELLGSAKRNRASEDSIKAEWKEAKQKVQKVAPLLRKQMQNFLKIKTNNWEFLSSALIKWHNTRHQQLQHLQL